MNYSAETINYISQLLRCAILTCLIPCTLTKEVMIAFTQQKLNRICIV